MRNYLTFDQQNQATNTYALTALQIFIGTLVLTLSSHIRIPLFFTPIPLTLQTLAIFFIGSALGSKKGALSILTYLAAGSLSAFSLADIFIIGPTGGYLIGFVAQATIAGLAVEQNKEYSFTRIALYFVSATLLTLTLGTLWLGMFVGASNMFGLGFLPFIWGDVLKSLIAAKVVTHFLGKARN